MTTHDNGDLHLPELLRNAEVARFLSIIGLSKEERSREPFRHSEFSKHIHKDSYPDFPFHIANATTLAALAQLGVTRLGVARAIISLIDTDTQHILAEAVPLWLTDPEAKGTEQTRNIYTGCGNLPRKDGFCELVLNPNNVPHDGALTPSGCVVLTNLRSTQRTAEKRFLEHNGMYKFYAGAPIRSGNGSIIGTYCMFCIHERKGLTDEEQRILEELAIAVSNQLETLLAQYRAQRCLKLVSGLHMFNNGFNVPSNISFWSSSGVEVQEQRWKTRRTRTPRLMSLDKSSSFVSISRKMSTGSNAQSCNESVASEDSNDDHDINDGDRLWRRSLAPGTLRMFGQAASILRTVTEYDGVAFFYMNASQAISLGNGNVQSGQSIHVVRSKSQKVAERDGPCRILGSDIAPDCTSSLESISKHFTTRDLDRIVGQRPQSKTISILWNVDYSSPLTTSKPHSPNDTISSGYSSSITATVENSLDGAGTQMRGPTPINDSRITALLKIDPNARHFIALPLWDHERQRWFATCICWTSQFKDDTALEEDLQYLRTFSDSIMVSLSRIDADTTLQKKESFVASISHELRSPLHGILGSLDLLKETEHYGSQPAVFQAIYSCSRTLLDTLDHVIDFAGINTIASNDSNTGRGTNTNTTRSASSYELVDIAELVEEVADALWLGQCQGYAGEVNATTQNITRNRNAKLKRQFSNGAWGRRGLVRFSLLINYQSSWRVRAPGKAIRRMLASVLGNALKFTESGFITLDLSALTTPDSEKLTVDIRVEDSGCGMSTEYMDNHLFQPFSQETSISAGAGLGLSIVKQLVDDMNGNITVSSKVFHGTDVQISLPLTSDLDQRAVDSHDPSSDWSTAIRAKTLTLSTAVYTGRSATQQHCSVAAESSNELQLRYLVQTIRSWFCQSVSTSNTNDFLPADIYILLEPNFDLLKHLEQSMDSPWDACAVLVAHDFVELAALRTDERVARSKMQIEFLVQPFGPRKLGHVLENVLQRPRIMLNHTGSSSSSASEVCLTQPDLLQNIVSQVVTPRTPIPILPTVADTNDLRKILVVDDNSINLRLISSFLQKKSIPFVVATNGQEAVDVYVSEHSLISLILMDISMPVMTGIEATQHIRQFELTKHLSRVWIIALTGLVNDRARIEAEEAGMDEYLTKPADLKVIARMAEMYMRNDPVRSLRS